MITFFLALKKYRIFCNWSRHDSFLCMCSATRIQLDVDLWNFLIILAEISSSTLLLQISKSQLFFPIWNIIASMHQIWETYRNKLKTVRKNWSSYLKIFCKFSAFSLEFQKLFSITGTFFLLSRSKQFLKQNAIDSQTSFTILFLIQLQRWQRFPY